MAELLENDRLTGPYVAVEGQTDFPADWPLVRAEAVRVRRVRGQDVTILSGDAVAAVDVGEAGFTARLTDPCEAGDEIQVFSLLAASRPRAHVPGGATRSATLEGDATEAMALIQEIRRDLGRAYMSPLGTEGGELPEMAGLIEAAEALAEILENADEMLEGRAATDASNIDAEAAEAWRSALYDYDWPVEMFGAKANDAAFDNTAAIQAAENHAATHGGNVRFRGGAAYYFKGTLTITRWRACWTGPNTRLIYNGADTTRDLIVYGQALPGAETKGARILGPFILQSATAMTAGTAFHAKNCVENVFEIDFQTQAGREALGHNLWHGFWGAGIATSTLWSQSIEVQKDGVRINGYATGPKSDMFINAEKIGACECGVRLGGGFGGLYLSDQTTLIGNKSHLIVDQTLFAEGNRELFCDFTIFDYTSGEAGVIFRDGDILAGFSGGWIAGGVGAGLLVEASSVAKITVDGVRFFLNRAHPTNGRGGDGVRVESAGAYVTITGGQNHSNDGWGINPTVVNNVVQYSGVHMWDNGAGEVNPTFGSVIRTHFSPILSRSLAGWSNVICGAPGNTNFQMKFFDPGTGGGFNTIPLIQFDTEDYWKFTRSSNTLELFIGASPKMEVTGLQTQILNHLKWMANTNLDPLIPGQVSSVIVGNTLELRANVGGVVKKFVANLT